MSTINHTRPNAESRVDQKLESIGLVRTEDEVGRFDTAYVGTLVVLRWAILVTYLGLGLSGVIPIHPAALAGTGLLILGTNVLATYMWTLKRRVPWYDATYLFLDCACVTAGVLSTANLGYPVWLAYVMVMNGGAAEMTTRQSYVVAVTCVVSYLGAAAIMIGAGWYTPSAGVLFVTAAIMAFVGFDLTTTFDGNRRLRAYIRRLAVTDVLTGLANRRRLSDVLANPGKDSQAMAVIVMDVDNFKEFNDSYGHLAGDKLLSRLGDSLRTHFPEAHTLARYGGDEFVVLLPCHSVSVAEAKANCLISPDCPDAVPISIGIAMWPHDEATLDAALAAADDCLRDAKKAGKNRLSTVGTYN
jgi:diguanylate cyclase (GGDEF)-like protein